MGIGLIATLLWLRGQSDELIRKPRGESPTRGAVAATNVAESSPSR
jgi:hypothetical protein